MEDIHRILHLPYCMYQNLELVDLHSSDKMCFGQKACCLLMLGKLHLLILLDYFRNKYFLSTFNINRLKNYIEVAISISLKIQSTTILSC